MKAVAGIVGRLVVGARADRRRHRDRLRGHDPGEPVDDVDAVGQPHAAAVEAAAVLGPAGAAAPVLRHVAHRGDDRPQLPGVEDLLGLDAGGVEVLRQAHHQLDAVGARRFDHVVALLQGDGHRLLDQHVLAGVAGVDGQPLVELVAEHHRHRVHFSVFEQFRMRGVAARDSVLLHELRPFLLEEVGDGDDLDAVEAGDGVAVRGGDAAQSDDSYPYHGSDCSLCVAAGTVTRLRPAPCRRPRRNRRCRRPGSAARRRSCRCCG